MRENRTYGLTRGSGETHIRGEPDSTLRLSSFRTLAYLTQKEGAEKDFRDGLFEPGGRLTALQQILSIHDK